MKRFFFDLENDNALRLLAKLPVEEGKRQEAINACSYLVPSKSDNLIIIIWALYDLADEIGDQRYDELFAGGQNDNNHKKQNWSRSRIEELYGLLIADRKFVKAREPKEEIYIVANITAGNIYLRLSHCYLEVFEYEMARECAQKGREHLWAALQEQQYQKDHGKFAIYKLLIHLNLAKYNREWAALTRRSNYTLALRELDTVFHVLEVILGRNPVDVSGDGMRQLALIYTDAMITKGRILRMNYCLKESGAYLAGVAERLSEVNSGQNTDKLSEIYQGIIKDIPEINRFCPDALKDLHKYLNPTDWKSCLLSVYIQMSLVWIKQRKYEAAQKLLTGIEQYEPSNRDAKNNLGICYRKQRNYDLAINKFLSVVRIDSSKAASEKLPEFLSSEVSRIKKENENLSVFIVENDVSWEAEDNRFAYINILKCVLNQYEADRLDHVVFTDALFIIENRLKRNPRDYEVQLLKCRYLMEENRAKQDRMEEAVAILEDIITKEELSYIRRGSIGLKARYLLSECYLRKFRFNEAEKLLLSIRTELYKDGTNILENQVDIFVENNIGWCLMQQGRHDEAKICYEKLVESLYNISFEEKGEDKCAKNYNIIKQLKIIFGKSMAKFFEKDVNVKNITEDNIENKKKIRQWKNSTRLSIPCLNNIGESFLRAGNVGDNRKYAKAIFDLILRIEPNNGLAHLHRGYCEADNITERAHQFEQAFRYTPDNIEIRSGYLINMVESFLKAKEEGKIEEIEKYSLKIADFFNYIPYSYSLNMCLALLKWKARENGELQDSLQDNGIGEEGSGKMRDFYKDFSRIELFHELGTRAFRRLKNKSGFRHLKAVERGQIMAQLLLLYEPIIKIRKKCHYQYKDWKELVGQTLVWNGRSEKDEGENKNLKNDNEQNSNAKKYRSGLVHYTKLDTLRALLDQNGTPHLRVSNSGYMNDASEGEIFFEEMRYAVKDLGKENEIDDLIQCYFHELKGDPDKVLPRGGNVYITSLSTQADSFPMWDIYAGKEQGCNIQFDEDFFDLKGSSWGVLAMEKAWKKKNETDQAEENKDETDQAGLDYSISTYTDDDYPLYAIQYVYRDHYMKEGQNQPNETTICSRDRFNEADENQMDYAFLKERLKEIAERWCVLHKLLEDLSEHYSVGDAVEQHIVEEAVDEIRAFVADRINEVRYLFKDRDYSFEGEVRLVRVVDADDTRAHTDSREIPRAFTEVDKEIKDIVVTLGSKLSEEQVNEITTWLRHTGRVKDVKIATRNRMRWIVGKQ